MKISSWRLVLLVATAVSFIAYPRPASANDVRRNCWAEQRSRFFAFVSSHLVEFNESML